MDDLEHSDDGDGARELWTTDEACSADFDSGGSRMNAYNAREKLGA